MIINDLKSSDNLETFTPDYIYEFNKKENIIPNIIKYYPELDLVSHILKEDENKIIIKDEEKDKIKEEIEEEKEQEKKKLRGKKDKDKEEEPKPEEEKKISKKLMYPQYVMKLL